jgi:hypothetical protein
VGPNENYVIHSFSGSLFLSQFVDVVKVAIDPQKDFSQIWLQVECGSNKFQNILPYFLGTLLKIHVLEIWVFSLSFGQIMAIKNLQKQLHFSNFNFEYRFFAKYIIASPPIKGPIPRVCRLQPEATSTSIDKSSSMDEVLPLPFPPSFSAKRKTEI